MRMSINTPEDSTVNEQFVKLVHETPILWNLHLPLYRNRDLKDQKWAEIGAAFSISGADAYKKFVALREKYKREQKLRESKSIAQTECWRLYDKMKFLDTVSFCRDRRWSRPKVIMKRHHSTSSSNGFHPSVAASSVALLKQQQDLAALIKTEFPEMQQHHHSLSVPTSPSYQMSGEPSENESSEAYQDNSDYYNDSTMQGANSEEPETTGAYGEKIESIPDVHPHHHPEVVTAGTSSSASFLNRLEDKTNAILGDYEKKKSSWVRCETLGQRVAQTMHALEEHDPDLALKFDIMLSEAITSIKKDQLQRLLSRQEEERRKRSEQERQQPQGHGQNADSAGTSIAVRHHP